MTEKIAVLGIGNVGLHLTKAFSENNFEVYFWNRTKIETEILNTIPNAIQLNSISEIPEDTKLCIISSSENAISIIAENLTNFKGIIAHSSGSVSINILDQFTTKAAVVYPLQTFSKGKNLNYSEIPVFIEANNLEILNEIENIVKSVFPKTEHLNSDKRKQLHLAAVFANNFVNACVMAAKEISDESEIDFSLLKPLIKETLNKLEAYEPEKSQTGPAVRKNQKILDFQINLLENKKELQEIYKSISFYITKKLNK